MVKNSIGLLSAYTVESFGESLTFNSKGPMKYVSLNNEPCQTRPTLVNINSDKIFSIPLLLMLISVAEVVLLLMVHMLEFVFMAYFSILSHAVPAHSALYEK